MAKKFQLTELKVTSFITTLDQSEQKTAKGGNFGARRVPVMHQLSRWENFTGHKTQIKVSGDVYFNKERRSPFGK